MILNKLQNNTQFNLMSMILVLEEILLQELLSIELEKIVDIEVQIQGKDKLKVQKTNKTNNYLCHLKKMIKLSNLCKMLRINLTIKALNMFKIRHNIRNYLISIEL